MTPHSFPGADLAACPHGFAASLLCPRCDDDLDELVARHHCPSMDRLVSDALRRMRERGDLTADKETP
jgi:hypothetical protein